MVRAKVDEVELGFETPESIFGIPLPKIAFKGKITPDDTERNFAWTIYVELATRIALVGLGQDEGSLREALSSYYAAFTAIRAELLKAGPLIGRRARGDQLPIAGTVLWMLNGVMRPVLAKWHPRLTRWEESRPPETGAFTHEAMWQDAPELRRDLRLARDQIEPFARMLEALCGVNPSLIGPSRS
jgi:hypothetical protein